MEKHKNKKAKGVSGKEKINLDIKLLYGTYVGVDFVVEKQNGNRFDI